MAQALTGVSSAIRDYVCAHYVSAAKSAGSNRFSVNAGEVHRAMHLHNRVPQVCSVLQSAKFLAENGLRIVEKSGPPSGFSTSVTVTYEFTYQHQSEHRQHPLLGLRGSLREVFRELGGGENFIRAERQAFSSALEQKRGER